MFCLLFIFTFDHPQDIFNTGGGSQDRGMSAENSTILIGAVMLVTSFICPLLVDRVGRKPLLLVGCFGQAVALLILAVYMYVLREVGGYALDKWKPVCQTALVAYVGLFALGLGPIPWLVAGEMFAADVRLVACACVAAIAWLLTFALSASWFFLRILVGYDAAFGVFAVICIVGGTCILLLLPEMRGQTFQEIQSSLRSKHHIFIKKHHREQPGTP